MAYSPIKLARTSADGVNSYSSTSGSLWAGNVFTGAGEQNDYTYVGVDLETDEAGTLTFEFSQDGTNWSQYPLTEFTITSGINEVHGAWKGTRYVRPIFIGNNGTRTYFRLRTMYSDVPITLTAPLNESILADQDASVVRAVSIGQDNAGNFRNAKVDEGGNLSINLVSPLSTFGELLQVPMTPEVQVIFPYNINLDLVTTGSNGSATITHSGQLATISSGVTPGSSGSLHTVNTSKYRAGQGVDVRYTAIFQTGSASDSRIYTGPGDENDGYFFGVSGSAFGIWHRYRENEDFIPQTSFNVDTMDGSGNLANPSGQSLDIQKGNVFKIEYQWLGFGGVKFYIEETTTSAFFSVHKLFYANRNVLTSTDNPTFPVRFEVHNGSGTDDTSVKTASISSFIQGVNKITGPTNSVEVSAASAENKNLLTLKNNELFPLGSSTTNKVNIKLSSISLGNDGNNINSIKIVEDAIITAPTYTFIDGQRSVISYDTVGTYSVGTGKQLVAYTLVKDDSVTDNVKEFEYQIRPGHTLSFISTGTSTNTSVIVTWAEDF